MADVDEVPAAQQPPKPVSARARGRALSDFPDLSPEERRLIDACRRGEICELGPSRPEQPSDECRINAGLVRFLALGGDELAVVHEKGVQLRGAWLEGILDLGDCDLVRPIALVACRVDAIKADDAKIPALVIENSLLEKGLNGDRLICKGLLVLGGKESVVAAKVSLRGSEIGALTCSGRFEGTPSDNVVPGEAGRETIDLSNAHIRGDAVLADVRATGTVGLPAANIGGNLIIAGGRFDSAGSYALICDAARIARNVFIRENFRAEGMVRFSGAEIDGDLDLSGARLHNSGNSVLRCDRTRVAGSAQLGDGFHATGSVTFVGADVGGNFVLAGAQLHHAGKEALQCYHLKVGGNVFLTDDFHAKGSVDFRDTTIGSNIFGHGGHIENPDGVALDAERAEIAGDLSLRGQQSAGKAIAGFKASGLVRLSAAHIGRSFYWEGATFDGGRGKALQCDGARVDGVFFARKLGSATGDIDLLAMHVGVLADDVESWAKVHGNLLLDGFTYSRFAGDSAPRGAAARIAWLDRQQRSHLTTEFRPQPWEQLMSVLRAMGHPLEVRQVAIERQRRVLAAARPQSAYAGWLFRKWVIGESIGFGYAPWRLAPVVIALWLAFGSGYWWATHPGPERLRPVCSAFVNARDAGAATPPPAGSPARPQPRAVSGGKESCGPTTPFRPFLYSLDALLPIDLGYQSAFRIADGRLGAWLLWIVAIQNALGWLAFGLLVFALNNLIKRD